MSKAVKQVAGVAAIAVGAYFGQPWLVAIGAGMLAQSFVKTPDAGQLEQSELKQIVRSSKEPAHYVFGRAGTGALLAWAQEEPGEQDEGERLYLAYVLTEGTIEGIDQIYVDQETIDSAGDRIEYEVISGATEPNGYMLEHSPDWQETQIGRGLTWVRVTLKYDPEYFAAGIPNLLFEYRARNDIYDPRSEAYGYTDNAALIILWYVRNRLGVPDDEILWDSFIDAANVCDEIITNPDGSTERRYTVSGGFKADERKDRILADLEAACAGSLIRVGGKFGLQVGAYYGPYELVIDEDMVVGTVKGQTEVSRANAVNTMRGKFISPEQRWTETDYPAVSIAEWVEEDGEQIEESLDLRYVSSPYQAQRLANIALRRKRAGGVLELPLNFRGYACRPGRVVQVNLPTLNIVGEFRVDDWDFNGENGCVVTLSQEHADIYDDAAGQAFDPGSFINLPTGGIGSPTGLQYVIQTVGEVIQGVLLWNPVDAALHYNVVIKRDGLAVQSAQVPAGVERCEIGGLEAGQYTAEVRARGRLGLSGPASINFTVLAPATPERVIFTRGNREVTLIPQLPPGASLSGGYYRYYVTQSEGATQPQSTYLGEGLTFTHTGLSPATRYYYYVQSVNAYGSSGFLRVDVETTNDFQEEIERVEEGLRKPGGIVDQFENDIGNLDTAIEGVRTDVDAATDAANSALADASTALQEAQEALDAANGADAKSEAAQQQADDALQRAQNALNSIDLVILEEQVQRAALSARISGANASVDVERTVRIAEDQALAQQIITLQAELGESVATLTQRLTALATTTDALSELYTGLRAEFDDATAAFEQQISALASQTESIVQTVESLTSQLGDMSAQIEETQQTLVINQLAQATINAALQVRNTLGAAAIDVERTVRVDEDRALATLITTLETTFNDASSSFEERITSLSDATQALTEQLSTLRSDFDDNSAAVEQQLTALVTTTQSITQSLESLRSDFDDSAASVDNRLIALADDQSATAGELSTFRAEVEGEFAEVQQEVSAVYDPETGAVAQAVTTINVNGVRGVLGIQVQGEEAQIIGVADKFAIFNEISGELVTAFVVSDGRVIMPEAFIDTLTMSKLRSSTGSLVFEDDRLQAAFIAVEQLRVQWGQIENVLITNAQIENEAVDTSKIRDLSVSTGKIQDLAVDTLKIRGRAVTVAATVTASGVIQVTNGAEALSVHFDPEGGDCVVTFCCNVTSELNSRCEIRRNGSVIARSDVRSEGAFTLLAPGGRVNGVAHFSVHGFGGLYISNRYFMVQSTKR
ncbi:phage tail tip protein J-related protein [Halomonas sp. 86]|uniref:phage tail tip protein J-related protein n=1 Tax=unclassified Halomonas TaxID=2609666 RepID=UPI004034A3AD